MRKKITVNKNNLLIRLWYGDVTLWKTYWLFSLVALIWQLPIELFVPEDDYKIRGVASLLDLSFEIIWFICVWRAANKYFGKIYWYYLSKLSVLAFLIYTCFDVMRYGGLF